MGVDETRKHRAPFAVQHFVVIGAESVLYVSVGDGGYDAVPTYDSVDPRGPRVQGEHVGVVKDEVSSVVQMKALQTELITPES